MNEPKPNQKVIIMNDKKEVGTIHKIFPPCEEHSGRIIVYVSSRRKQYYTEFWYSDIGKSLILL